MTSIQTKDGMVHYVRNRDDAMSLVRHYCGDDLARYVGGDVACVKDIVEEWGDELAEYYSDVLEVYDMNIRMEEYRNAMLKAIDMLRKLIMIPRRKRSEVDRKLEEIKDVLEKEL